MNMITQTYQHQHSVSSQVQWGTCPKCGRYEWHMPDGDLTMWSCGYAAGVHVPDKHERQWGSYISPEEMTSLRAANAALIEQPQELKRKLPWHTHYTGPTKEVACKSCQAPVTIPAQGRGRVQEFCDKCYYERNRQKGRERWARKSGKK
jgi:hypothetical protein